MAATREQFDQSTRKAPPRFVDRQHRAKRMIWWQLALLVIVGGFSLAYGATGVSPLAVIGQLLSGQEVALSDRVVLLDIRLPRMVLGILVGASLAVSGALMQGLFRNPLADPGLVGVSAGAALGAISAIVLGGMLPVAVQVGFGYYLVPLAAFSVVGHDHPALSRRHAQRPHIGCHDAFGRDRPWRAVGCCVGDFDLQGQ